MGKERKKGEDKIKLGKISVIDAVAIVTGMVIGPGIFKTPSLVAANSSNEYYTLALWLAGGVISLIGALSYAELTTAYPDTGGEYHFLSKSFGKDTAFLFAWARMMVIQTGSIAMLAFIIGDYGATAFNFGVYSPSIYAAAAVLILTTVNLSGLRQSSRLQKVLMSGIFIGIIMLVVLGFTVTDDSGGRLVPDNNAALGQAMIFVLLTYGGWNEAAYLSRDINNQRSGMLKVLFFSIGLITFTYLIINYSLMNALGFGSVMASETVAADLIAKTLGSGWVQLISVIIAVAAFSTVNAVMITGARTNYALGRDFGIFRFLSSGAPDGTAPANSFLFQSFIALMLIMLGSYTRTGFITMVEYTAPVFWFFFLLTGVSLFVLRIKDPLTPRPFKVPLYPLLPFIFCAAALYMLYSSLVYTGIGALIGVLVLIAGVPFLILNKLKHERKD